MDPVDALSAVVFEFMQRAVGDVEKSPWTTREERWLIEHFSAAATLPAAEVARWPLATRSAAREALFMALVAITAQPPDPAYAEWVVRESTADELSQPLLGAIAQSIEANLARSRG